MSGIKKPLNKLSRYELVELIFQLRKENLDLQNRCVELEERLAHSDELLDVLAQRSDAEALRRIEAMLTTLCVAADLPRDGAPAPAPLDSAPTPVPLGGAPAPLGGAPAPAPLDSAPAPTPDPYTAAPRGAHWAGE